MARSVPILFTLLIMPDTRTVQYDIHKDPHRNIALPDSLLSRFDLLFVVTDDVDETRDRQIADHVLRMHRYLPPGVEEGTPVTDSLSSAQPLAVDGPARGDADDDAATDTNPFEKYDPLLHVGIGSGGRTRSGRTKKKEVLSIKFVKKYVQYAKSKTAPVLSKGAADYIVSVYADLRNEATEGSVRRVSIPSVRRCFYDGVDTRCLRRPRRSPRVPSKRLSVSRPPTRRRASRRR